MYSTEFSWTIRNVKRVVRDISRNKKPSRIIR